jgi:DNA-binding CsgD family transcriptional regulator
LDGWGGIELVGRDRERAAIDAVLDSARSGRRGALMIRGEAGIGKSSLLEYARRRAEGFTVLHASGVEFEAELPFATLHQLLMPVLERRSEISRPQAQALEAAFALHSEGEGTADRFAVCAATLSLISSAAEVRPVLWLVDDLQWVDPGSFQAIRFAVRRLSADAVAAVFAQRDGDRVEGMDIDELRVSRLDAGPAAELFRRLARQTRIPDGVGDQAVVAAAGNPLALVEIAGSLDEYQLRGIDPLRLELPTPASMQRVFEQRTARLEPAARRAVALVAACASGDLAVIAPALGALGIEVDALGPAAEAGLLDIEVGEVKFCHPLMRTAAYWSATPAEQRAAHQALAESAVLSPVERAWHGGLAADGPDDAAAQRLEDAALEAGRRGGPASHANMLVFAARLTTDPERRVRRLLAAVDAGGIASRRADTEDWLRDAAGSAEDPVLAGEVALRSANLMSVEARYEEAEEICTGALDRLPPGQDELAALLWVRVAGMRSMSTGCESAFEAVAAAKRLDVEPGGPADVRLLSAELRLGVHRGDGLVGELAEKCLRAATAIGETHTADEMTMLLSLAGEFGLVRKHLLPAIERQRRRGELPELAFNLDTLAEMHLFEGRLSEAQAASEESARICLDLGLTQFEGSSTGMLATIMATMGREDRARELIRRAEKHPEFTEVTATAIGRLELSLGRTDQVIRPLRHALEHSTRRGIEDTFLLGFVPDLVETYVELGHLDDARAALTPYEQTAERTRRPWSLAMVERCHGLLADDAGFEAHFRAAIGLHREESPYDAARTFFAFGRRLAHTARREEAVAVLGTALERFTSIGAKLWAARTHEELGLLGEHRAAQPAPVLERLTAQELQVATAVAGGATNRETAAQLFLSVKTVEYHLHNIYRKLAIRSRTQLAGVLLSSRATPVASHN